MRYLLQLRQAAIRFSFSGLIKREINRRWSNTVSVSITLRPIRRRRPCTVTSPTASQTMTSPNVTVTGTASDGSGTVSGVAAVYVSINSATVFKKASGNADWTTNLTGTGKRKLHVACVFERQRRKLQRDKQRTVFGEPKFGCMGGVLFERLR